MELSDRVGGGGGCCSGHHPCMFEVAAYYRSEGTSSFVL